MNMVNLQLITLNSDEDIFSQMEKALDKVKALVQLRREKGEIK